MKGRMADWAPCLVRMGVEEGKGCVAADGGNSEWVRLVLIRRLLVIQIHLAIACGRLGNGLWSNTLAVSRIGKGLSESGVSCLDASR